jgi:hypothetical protein
VSNALLRDGGRRRLVVAPTLPLGYAECVDVPYLIRLQQSSFSFRVDAVSCGVRF